MGPKVHHSGTWPATGDTANFHERMRVAQIVLVSLQGYTPMAPICLAY